MTFETWLQEGIDQGFCSAPVCATHDGLPLEGAEEADEDAMDFCIPAVRLLEDR